MTANELPEAVRGRVQLSLPLDSEEAAVLYVDEVVDGEGFYQHLDKVLSVSGLTRLDYPGYLELQKITIVPEALPSDLPF